MHVGNTSWAERSAPPSVAVAARRRPRGQRSTANFQVFNLKFSSYRKIVSLNPGLLAAATVRTRPELGGEVNKPPASNSHERQKVPPPLRKGPLGYGVRIKIEHPRTTTK